MLWQGRRESDNVEDRRGMSGGGMLAGGGIGTIIIGIIYFLLGGNPSDITNQVAQPQQTQSTLPRSPEEEKLASFTRVILADTEDVWGAIFKENGQTYKQPRLVMFTQQTQSGCGFSSAATGPFYCPGDEKSIY